MEARMIVIRLHAVSGGRVPGTAAVIALSAHFVRGEPSPPPFRLSEYQRSGSTASYLLANQYFPLDNAKAALV